MKLRERIKSMSFWTGLVGAVFLILGAFGVEIGDQTASTVLNAVCSALVLLGIVTPPKSQAENGGDSTDEVGDESDGADEGGSTYE